MRAAGTVRCRLWADRGPCWDVVAAEMEEVVNLVILDQAVWHTTEKLCIPDSSWSHYKIVGSATGVAPT